MKLTYLLWGAELKTSLHDGELRRALSCCGVSELQVNIRDEYVAAAELWMCTYDTPVDAVVTLRGVEDPDQITALLRPLADRLDGFVVDELTPLRPPRTDSGVRADALARIAVMRIPAGMTRAQWLENWIGDHTQVALDNQASLGYIQNPVLGSITPDGRVDAVVEELFPMAAMSDPHAYWGSGGDDAELERRCTRMLDSIARFGADRDLDVIPTSRYVYSLR
ncbi:hypothetical protein [Nocardia sp. NPDC059229]|uniref:hypothetical protein n=1 Tax=Nocardia sp. NPDC059229 TaxID=3346778 RepID=UPI00367A9B97